MEWNISVRQFFFLGWSRYKGVITKSGYTALRMSNSLLPLLPNCPHSLHVSSVDFLAPDPAMHFWKVVAEPWKTPGFLASRGEFNLGPEMRLDCSALLCNKVLLKCKRGRESFWHTHQKGAERVPSPQC